MEAEQKRRINEKISAWFEPKPTNENGAHRRIYSPHGFWSYMDDPQVTANGWIPRYDFFTSEEANAKLRDRMLVRVDTPELLEICGEDQWISLQRSIWHRINRRIDTDIPVASIYREEMVYQLCKFAGIEANEQ